MYKLHKVEYEQGNCFIGYRIEYIKDGRTIRFTIESTEDLLPRMTHDQIEIITTTNDEV